MQTPSRPRSFRALAALTFLGVVASSLTALPSVVSATPDPASRVSLESDDTQAYSSFIVKFAEDTAESRSATDRAEVLSDVSRTTGVRTTERQTMAIGAQVLDTDQALAGTEARSFMEGVAKEAKIEWIQPNYRKRLLDVPSANRAPVSAEQIRKAVNDPRFKDMWHLGNKAGGMNVPPAWDVTEGAGVVVGVVDTGITKSPEFEGRLLPGYDMITKPETARDNDGRDANPQDEGDWSEPKECDPKDNYGGDSSWHGSHVAGTIAANTNNGIGIAGVAGQAKIVPVRGLGRCGGEDVDVNDGVLWAAGVDVPGAPKNANPAKIINLSAGDTKPCQPADQAMLDKLTQVGALLVAAAGNSSEDAKNNTPSSCKGSFAVGSIGREGAMASYSNYGSTVHIAGPGGSGGISEIADVLSVVDKGRKRPEGPSFGWKAGTSMAAPHIAGLAALVQAKNPSYTADQIRNAITKNTKPAKCPKGCGAGLADAEKAIRNG